MSGAAPSLTLPGSIRGLLRRGSPVLVPLPRVRKSCLRGLVDGVDIDSDGVWVLTRDGAPTMWVPSDIALDLEVDTGRAHAVRWWNSQRQRSLYICDPSFGYMTSPAVRYLSAGRHLHAVSRSVGRPGYLEIADVVPSLAELDPNDPRLLPDGSRRVDAEALLLVCRHVAGLPVGGSP